MHSVNVLLRFNGGGTVTAAVTDEPVASAVSSCIHCVVLVCHL